MARKRNKYINRELSWLEFNHRVLEEAHDAGNPLLERLKFLAITSSNLDEFFMVRVGGLQMLVEQKSGKTDPSGMTPVRQLKAISRRTHEMTAQQYSCFLDDLEPKLADVGIKRLDVGDLSERQAHAMEHVFHDEISAVLTPMAVSADEEFPLLVAGMLNVCVRLIPSADAPHEPRFAIVPFGPSSSRFITLPSDGGYEYVLLEDVVSAFVERFFPGEQVEECVPFRVTRNADISIREDMASDLLSEMQELLDARKETSCVRLEVSRQASKDTLAFLHQVLEVEDDHIYSVPGPLDLTAFMRLTDLQGFDDLRCAPWPARPSPRVDLTTGMFETLSQHDVLLYHPYESFEPVIRLIEEAADDPEVLAIKQTLYRTSPGSPIVAALMRAAKNGKSVAVIVELKARFDEARNIEWAKHLEQAGVQVIYGVKGLKTHAKVCIIIRREAQGIQRYVHFGTGNYNEVTARLYSDVSYMTSHEELAADATSFFNAVTGYSQPQHFRKIEAAPIGLREKLLEMIESETQRKRHGQKARIMIKLNSLVDPALIDALYAASQAGVKIDLNVRGICCLLPGVEGLSENISVTSIVDRYLEHARILYFYHGGDERIFISSADWMPRNLDRRVELLVPVEDEISRKRLVEIFKIHLQDTVKASRLLPDGSYERLKPAGRRKKIRSQQALYESVCDAVRESEQSRRTVFEPHRAPGAAS